NMRGVAESAFRISDHLNQVRGDVVWHVVVDLWLAIFGGDAEVDRRRERLPVHFDQANRVFGDISVVGDDHGHGLADVTDFVDRQWALGAAVGQARVGHDQRRGLVEIAQIGGGEDRVHTRV